MLAFNFFFLPPLYTFTLADREQLAGPGRVRGHCHRRREPRGAGTAHAERTPSSASASRPSSPTWQPTCCEGHAARGGLRQIEERTAAVLGVSSVRIALGERPRASTHELAPSADRRGPHHRRPTHARERGAGTRNPAPLPAGARVSPGSGARTRGARARGARGRRAPPERHGQDGGDPGGLARPPHPARDDRAGNRRARER